MHRGLLCWYSAHIRKQLDEKPKKKTFEIDVTADTLALFIGWIYTGVLSDQVSVDGVAMNLYVLAHQLEVLALRRSIMTYLYIHSNDKDTGNDMGLASFESIRTAIEKLPDSAQFLVYQRDHYGNHWYPDSGGRDIDHAAARKAAHPDFLYDVMSYQARLRDKPTEEGCECCKDPCKYHEHDNEAEHEASE